MIARPPEVVQIAGSPSLEEAAAITGALARFERDTAPRPANTRGQSDQWARTAILESVLRGQDDAPDPWINT